MAAHLKRLAILSTGFAAAVFGAACMAENLLDPTRPPSAMGVGLAVVEPSGSPILQSVLISPQRRVAIINGETVQVGDSLGEARVVKISETEVILQVGKERRALRMYPDVERKLTAASSEPRANKQKQ